MYASYFYNAGGTVADILSDVVAMLTGETTVANLSASCDKTSTTITATASVAGWSVYDASAGTNAQVLRAAVHDNANQFKYLLVDTNNAGYILITPYETWDNTLHNGTYNAYQSTTISYQQQINTTRGGGLEISVNAQHLCIYGKTPTTEWGSPSGGMFPTCVFERTRLSIWDTVNNGYLPVVFTSNMTTGYECRRRDADGGADVASSSAGVSIYSTMPVTPPTTSVAHFVNGTSNYYPLLPFGYAKDTDWHLGGWVSYFADIFYSVRHVLGMNDTVVLNNNEYVIWQLASGYTLAVRKG